MDIDKGIGLEDDVVREMVGDPLGDGAIFLAQPLAVQDHAVPLRGADTELEGALVGHRD